MKLIYCIHSVYNPGGMERVLLNKVSYLVSHYGWDITIVTTNQNGRSPFYPFPATVKMIDLGINYSAGNDEGPLKKILTYFKKRRLHQKCLHQYLEQEKADVVISLFPSESSFIPAIKDGSKKVLELHFNKFFRLLYNRVGIIGLLDHFRIWQDERLVRKFDKFVVLTEEDKGYWGKLRNIEAIPNAVKPTDGRVSDVTAKRVIAVGRLDYQKGFDRLIKAWDIVAQEPMLEDWSLDIFGQGEWQDMLEGMINERNLQDRVCINRPTNTINEEYLASSLIVMTSNYEGFGMVLVEAMSRGVPAVSFDCVCGPGDIISHGKNGLLVTNGDIEALAEAMKRIMLDGEYRKQLSYEAVKVADKYSEEKVMTRWYDLFISLKNS